MTNVPPPTSHPGAWSGQRASQPQLHIVLLADASVDSHSSKPSMPGFMTGHLR